MSDGSLRSSAQSPSSLVACSALARLRALLSPDGDRSVAPLPLTIFLGQWWVFIPVGVVLMMAGGASEAAKKPRE